MSHLACHPAAALVRALYELVEYFVAKHAMRSGKSIDGLEDDVVSSLQEYHWPGNVRELENAIERAVVLTTGSAITREAVTVEAPVAGQTAAVRSLKLRENVEWIAKYPFIERNESSGPGA